MSAHLTPVTCVLLAVILFSTHRCHLGRGQPEETHCSWWRWHKFKWFSRKGDLIQVAYFVKFRQDCVVSVSKLGRSYVSKKKHIVNKHQRKHTTTRKEGGRTVLVKSPLTQCQPRHDRLSALQINKTAQTLLNNRWKHKPSSSKQKTWLPLGVNKVTHTYTQTHGLGLGLFSRKRVEASLAAAAPSEATHLHTRAPHTAHSPLLARFLFS